ncbi:hypothetical protein NP493_898g00007 [Ridgeia piscesae]|uniref:Tetratricopeptide repeat protein 38 n=1 Tax=Ridgeia piscesae TaxID=27915 RepID=A0AAD9KMD0_RIDPI|nr:hypothetical protein NP493_898g00007 [Ridgeia piscesae]
MFQEWRNLGLPLSTTSNEACKLYDATLTQYIGWYDEASVGGLEASAAKLLEADPNFVMGHVMSIGLDLMGTGHSPRLDLEFQKSTKQLLATAVNAEISDREKRHVTAVKLCADGHMDRATNIWEDILVDHPLDMLALKFAHDSYFYLGFQPQMRDSIARVMPHWTTDMPHYGFLMGMYSFGLCETNMFAQAEKVARKGLEINRSDAWSTHSMAHVLEMQGRWKEGLTFLSSTVQDWEPCGMLACHNFWHWAVYHIEKVGQLADMVRFKFMQQCFKHER